MQHTFQCAFLSKKYGIVAHAGACNITLHLFAFLVTDILICFSTVGFSAAVSCVNQQYIRCYITQCIIIIIRSRRQQRSVVSTQSGHDDELWTIQHEC